MAAVMALVAMSASASLLIAYESEGTSNNDGSTDNFGTDVTAQAGDVLVFVTAKSKALAYTYNVTSGDGGVSANQTNLGWDGTKTLDLVTFDITTGGTFDFDVVTAGTSYGTHGVYLLRADYGGGESISLLDSSDVYNAAGISANTNSLSFAQSSGIYIGGYSSGSSTVVPGGLDGKFNSTTNRVSVTGTFTDATTQEYIWSVLNTSKNARTVGVAFEAIPEPATIGMLGLGGLLTLIVRRFKQS